jgi:uncharacterized cofD-like protein
VSGGPGSRGSRAPTVVAIGGGHGTAVTLRAVRQYCGAVTAVVSVADDGGSSGRLRELLDVVALGDMRKCLVALAAPGSVLARAFERRFDEGELAGHALGNLILAGLVGATGDLVTGVEAAARLLGAAGSVLPATTEPVVLKADAEDGEVAGQVAVSLAGRIRSISLVPSDAAPPPEVAVAVREADQVVIGPGSLFTSVLAAAAVPEVAAALAATSAQRVFVCNLRPQLPETAGYDVGRHLAALREHGVTIDVVLCDTSRGMALGRVGLPVLDRPLAGPNGLVHDPGKLASALSDLLL